MHSVGIIVEMERVVAGGDVDEREVKEAVEDESVMRLVSTTHSVGIGGESEMDGKEEGSVEREAEEDEK